MVAIGPDHSPCKRPQQGSFWKSLNGMAYSKLTIQKVIYFTIPNKLSKKHMQGFEKRKQKYFQISMRLELFHSFSSSHNTSNKNRFTVREALKVPSAAPPRLLL